MHRQETPQMGVCTPVWMSKEKMTEHVRKYLVHQNREYPGHLSKHVRGGALARDNLSWLVAHDADVYRANCLCHYCASAGINGQAGIAYLAGGNCACPDVVCGITLVLALWYPSLHRGFCLT